MGALSLTSCEARKARMGRVQVVKKGSRLSAMATTMTRMARLHPARERDSASARCWSTASCMSDVSVEN